MVFPDSPVDAIGAALRELEAAGYIVRHKLRDRQGRISDTEYVIYEQPQLRKPDTDSPDTENPYMDKPDTEKPAELNIEKSNTQKQNIYGSSTDSIPFRDYAADCLPERKGRDEALSSAAAGGSALKMLWWIAPSERSWNDEKDIGHQKARFAEYAVYPVGAVCYQFWRGMANGTRGGCFRKVSFAGCGSAWGAAKFLAKPASIGLVGRAVLCGVSLRLAVYLKSKNAKKYRHGLEYGSARWGTREDIAPYVDPVFQNNVILTKTESLTMNSRPKDPKTARNKNVLVIGGSGSGKTRFWLKPNLMQMHSSYVVTDPKGTILVECGKMLQRGAPKLGKDGNCSTWRGCAYYLFPAEWCNFADYGIFD